MLDVALIPLRNRHDDLLGHVLVDEADAEWAGYFKWRMHSGYACRYMQVTGETVFMHRELLGLVGVDFRLRQVDHINHNKLDNRRANLRAVTVSENAQNRRPTPYRGVTFHKASGLWRTQARVAGRGYSTGYFKDKDEAAASIAALRARLMPFSPDAQRAELVGLED